jgi:hypothetical protein
MERYDAKAIANMEVMEAPATAFEIAWRTAQVVKTLVGRPIQVAIVNGLNRKLSIVSNVQSLAQ